MLVRQAVLAAIASCAHAGNVFTWKPSNAVSDSKNWLDSDIPCDGDYIRFDKLKETVVFLEGNLKVDRMDLPDDGVIFFGERATLGDAGSWQCPKRKSSENVFYQPTQVNPSYFNASNWDVKDSDGASVNRPRLHCERIPGVEDTAVIPENTASEVYIEAEIKLSSLNISGQFVNNDQIRGTLLTIEGQFVFRLGDAVKSVIYVDNVDFQMPKNAITIKESAALGGLRSSNSYDSQMNAVCQYVTCQPVDGICTNSIKPLGHCCPICGALITFRQTDVDIASALDEIKQIEWRSLAKHPHIGISITRVDEADSHPVYQLTVLTDDQQLFDEKVFYATAQLALDQVQLRGRLAVVPTYSNNFGYYSELRETYSVDRRKIHFATVAKYLLVVVGIMAAVGFVGYRQYQRSPRFRLWINGRSLGGVAVAWQQTRDNLEDRVNIMLGRRRSSTLRGTNEGIASGSVEDSLYHAQYSNRVFANEAFEAPESSAVSDVPEKLIDVDL